MDSLRDLLLMRPILGTAKAESEHMFKDIVDYNLVDLAEELVKTEGIAVKSEMMRYAMSGEHGGFISPIAQPGTLISLDEKSRAQ